MDIVHEALKLRLAHLRRQRCSEQAERVQRLPQVMTCGGEELRLAAIG
jgi:hypothetical protein